MGSEAYFAQFLSEDDVAMFKRRVLRGETLSTGETIRLIESHEANRKELRAATAQLRCSWEEKDGGS